MLKKYWLILYNYFVWLFKTEYRIVEISNPLTDEIGFFIEYRKYHWWKTHKIKSEVFQHQFGCDKDGRFIELNNAIHIFRYLRGNLKVTKKIRADIQV